MNSYRVRVRGLACLVVLVLVAWAGPRASAQDLQVTGSNWTTVFPELMQSTAPAWVKPGVQLAWEYSTAFVPANPRLTQGMGAHGFQETTILGVEKNAVAMTTAMTLFSAGGPLSPSSGYAGVSPHTNELYISAEGLQKLANLNGSGSSASKGPITIDGKTYDALWVQTVSPNGEQHWVFDLATGIQLRSSSTVLVGGPNPGKQLGQYNFKGMRQLNLPWTGAQLPPAFAQLKSLDYRGTQSTTVIGTRSNFVVQLHNTFTVAQRGTDWAQYAGTFEQVSPNGGPGFKSQGSAINGAYSPMGGMFMPPEVLRNLKPGQVLDKDPITGFTLSVVGVSAAPKGGQMVTIRDAGAVHQTDQSYDLQSGVLLQFDKVDHSTNPGVVHTRLQLSGTE